MSSSSNWRSVSTHTLSYGSQRRIAAYLDAPNTLNWKDLLTMMPEYGPIQMQQLAGEERRGKSPTLALLHHMSSTGRRVGDLYDFARQLGMNKVCELIVQGLQERGITVNISNSPDSPQSPPSTTHYTDPLCLQSSRSLAKDTSSHSQVSTSSSSHESVKKPDVSHLISPSPSPAPTAPPISLEPRPTRLVSYDDVLKATGEFNETSFEDGGHKLGQGGFGQVFYCKMDLGEGMQEIAVKVFSDKTDSEMRLQFENELQIISRLNHPNLLPLLGYSCNQSSLCLLYPFIPLGSLDKHLKKTELGQQQRLKIIQDIASGLYYLHTGCGKVLVHRDVKSANVLLDQTWRAKLTDFGVARALSMGSSTAATQRIVGTRVYMAPEYCTGLVSPAADVYSLGVVMMELLFGWLALEGPDGSNTDLLSYLDECEQQTSDLYFPCWSQEDGQHLEELAEKCTSPNRYTRPTIEKILQSL